MEQPRIVAEDDEMRRLHADLRHIIDLEPAALVRRRLYARRGILKDVVEHAGGDTHGILVRHGIDRVIQLVHALAREGGDIQDGRVLHIAQVPANILRHLVHGVRVLLHRVPLVDHDDARLARLVGKSGDLRILLGHAVVCVQQDQAHVRALDGGDGAHVAVFFHRVVHLGFAAHPGGVDEQILAGLVFKIAVDGVARRPGHVGDDHALLAEDAVEQAGFSDVRLSDDGDLDDVLVILVGVIFREGIHAGVQQVARAVAVYRRHLDRIAETECIELIRVRVHAAGLVALVDSQHHGLFRLFEHGGDLGVRRSQADRDVHDHDDDVRRLNGDLRLTAHEAQHVVVGARLNAAGVHQQKIAAVPLAVAVDAVARHAGSVLHDRHAAAGELVKEHRLADVRPADDGYDGLCHNGSSLLLKRKEKGSAPSSHLVSSELT